MTDSHIDSSPGSADGLPFAVAGLRIWVTGASRGLGRAISLSLAKGGARLALTARSAQELGQVAGEARDLGGDPFEAPASVSDIEQVQACVEVLKSEWGGLDVLVNCAGVSPLFKRAEQVTGAEWQQVIDVNLTGTFRCSQGAAALMMASGGGSIINITSIHGRVGMARLAAYSASKGGIDALTRTLALEWAEHGIRVNAIAPGYFETDMTEALRSHDRWRAQLLQRIPAGRFGTPAEVASAVHYLATSASRYVTGTTITVDGGWTAG